MRKPRLLFCSYHCYLDPSSGAALSVRDLFRLLGRRGWECQVFCGPLMDFESKQSLPELMRSQGLAFEVRQGSAGAQTWWLMQAKQGEIPVVVYQPDQAAGLPTREQGEPFLGLAERALDWVKPDILLTYGGDWL